MNNTLSRLSRDLFLAVAALSAIPGVAPAQEEGVPLCERRLGDADFPTRKAIAAAKDINACDTSGRTALHTACYYMDCTPEIVRLLLEAGADANAKDSSGCTPLMFALQEIGSNFFYHTSMGKVSLLLQAGADVDAQDNAGMTPLMYAVDNGSVPVFMMLLNAGADVHKRDNRGRTPLMYAASYGYWRMVSVLLDRGADINARDSRGRTVLMQVCDRECSGLQALSVLLAAGADPNLEDPSGATALSLAIAKGNTAAANLLRSYGAR